MARPAHDAGGAEAGRMRERGGCGILSEQAASPPRPPGSQPGFLWGAVHDAALDQLPRALAAMGFEEQVGPFERYLSRTFKPQYQRHRPWRARMLVGESVQARGYRAGAWTPENVAAWDRAEAHDSIRVREFNQSVGFSPCRLLTRRGKPRALAVELDERTGEWRESSGGAFGDCLVDLAALCWRVAFTDAAWRLAKAIGMGGVPYAR